MIILPQCSGLTPASRLRRLADDAEMLRRWSLDYGTAASALVIFGVVFGVIVAMAAAAPAIWPEQFKPPLPDAAAQTPNTPRYQNIIPIWEVSQSLWDEYKPVVNVADNGHGEMVITIDGDTTDQGIDDTVYPWGVAYIAQCGGIDGLFITGLPIWSWQLVEPITNVGIGRLAHNIPIAERNIGGAWQSLPHHSDLASNYYADLVYRLYEDSENRLLANARIDHVVLIGETRSGQPDIWAENPMTLVRFYATTVGPASVRVEFQSNTPLAQTTHNYEGPSRPSGNSVVMKTWLFRPSDATFGYLSHTPQVGVSFDNVGATQNYIGRHDVTMLTATYPAAIQQNFRTMQLIASGHVFGAETLTLNAERGDMFISISRDNSTVSTSGWTVVATAPMHSQDESRRAIADYAVAYTPSDSRWRYTLEQAIATQAGAATLISHDTATDYTLWWHLRPLYDLKTAGDYGHQEIIIPKYLLSNDAHLTCSVWAYTGGIVPDGSSNYVARPWSASSGATGATTWALGSVSANLTRECAPRDNLAMPATRWRALTTINFFDLTPDDYCSTPEDQLNRPTTPPITPGPSLAAFNRSIPFYRAPDGLTPQPLHGYVNFQYVPEQKPGRMRLALVADGPTEGVVYSVENPSGSFCRARALGVTEGPRPFLWTVDPPWTLATLPQDRPLQLQCKGITVRSADASEVYGPYSFNITIPAYRPQFYNIVDDLNADVFGWGTGEDADGFQEQFMGVGFLAAMIMLSATAGFRKAHVPASLLIFFSIIALAAFFSLIDISTAVLSGILVVVIVGICSVGIRRR